MKPPFCVLTIAGSDSGAGAGVQADARTIYAHGGYALMAITALTAQNTRGVQAWRAAPKGILAEQVTAVLEDFPVAAVKTGLLPGATAVRVVAKILERRREIPLVVDPVIGSTSGTRFLSNAAVAALRKTLLLRAALVTPNWPEAAVIARRRVTTFDEAEAAAKALHDDCGCAVLVKGGHAPGDLCRDCLVTADGKVQWFESARVETRNAHGTGCVLSAAIAARLARGDSLVEAVKGAREFLWKSLTEGREFRWGNGDGVGPAFAG